jgi:hypothetical protein
MPWIKNFSGFTDFLSLVIVHAPDDFPREDYLDDHEQLNLEGAFEALTDGMSLVAKRVHQTEVLSSLRAELHSALVAYRRGDDVEGAHILQRFESRLRAESSGGGR